MGATNSTQSPVTLQTSKGTLRGLQFSDQKSGKPVYHRYTRIPYALPPVGPLRWQKPHPLPEDFSFSTNDGKPGDYTSFGPICPQPVYDLSEAFVDREDAEAEPGEVQNVQDEDCLYLNVWVPAGRDGEMPEGGWPVQFYIHGGWLQIGDAMQNNSTDPYDLLLHTSHPRIIVSPTYRLNIFGFLCCPTSTDPNSSSASPCPGNFGLWDQRLALEWTHQHISLFSGNPHNITLGGLSAGAYSSLFQLHYDIYNPHKQPPSPLIRRCFLWSNTVGIQPNAPSSTAIHSQFGELLSHFSIPPSTSPSSALSIFRTLPSSSLVSALPHLKSHTFRAVTDNAFIRPDFLCSIYNSDSNRADFSRRLKRHKIKILLGEAAHEERLYRLVHPAFNRAELETQLRNYYPPEVVAAQMRHYDLPSSSSSSSSSRQEYQTIYAQIVADAQIYAPSRALTHALLSQSYPQSDANNSKGLDTSDIFRYRICYRPKSLDTHLRPEMGVCHGADAVVWWCSAFRTHGSPDEEERRKVLRFLEPFGRFIYDGEDGNGIGWGTKSEREVREMGVDGEVRVVEDEGWERGLRVWDMMWKAHEEKVTNDL